MRGDEAFRVASAEEVPEMRSSSDDRGTCVIAALRVALVLGFLVLASPVAAESGGTVPLDDVPVAETVDPNSLLAPPAKAPGESDALPPVPLDEREAFVRAEEAMNEAMTRLEAANAVYGNMMARNYPTGSAKAAIITERDEARAAYDRAAARFVAIGGQIPAAQADRFE